MIKLHDYQERAVAGLRASQKNGHRSPLLVSPTGSGKTVMFSYMASRAVAKGIRTVVLVHRQELVEQVSATFGRFNLKHGFITSGSHYDRRYGAHIASVQTAVRRLERVEVPGFVIVDEAHHCISDSAHGKIIECWRQRNPKLFVVGVTATPERLSGEGLDDQFDDLVLGPTPAKLIESGHLCNYSLHYGKREIDLKGIPKRGGDYSRKDLEVVVASKSVIGDVIAEYRKHLNGAPSVSFCVSIKHATQVAEMFRSAGYRAACVDGSMDDNLRRSIITDFKRGALNMLASCDLISEGFDVPNIHGALLLRPTASLGLYLQQVGRALRTAPGKSIAKILDYVNNWATHGLPDDPRTWTLEGRKSKSDEPREQVITLRRCPICLAAQRPGPPNCKECGYVFTGGGREITTQEGKLVEVTREERERAHQHKQAQREQGAAQTEEQLVALYMKRGSDPDKARRRAQYVLEGRDERKKLERIWKNSGSTLEFPVWRKQYKASLNEHDGSPPAQLEMAEGYR